MRLVFATLGPGGSNHDWVAGRYRVAHRLDAAIALHDEFEAAFRALLEGRAQFVLQCAVHPSVAYTVGHYRGRAHLVDTFLSPSQPMAVLKRRGATRLRSLGLQPATRDYVDVTRFAELVSEPTTVAVGEGLLAGRYDAGLTLLRFLEGHRDLLELEQMIGTVVDPWLVWGTEPVCGREPLVWREGPAARLFTGAAGEARGSGGRRTCRRS